MGIRFTCHVCSKRLNVKSFLAGKRGICPHCAAKVDIPWESQPEGAAIAPTAAPRSVVGPQHSGANGSAMPVVPAVPVHASPAGNGQASPVVAQPVVPMAAPVAKAASPASYPASAPAPTVQSSPPPSARASDPIDEAPQAVWYVRPPSGGQYGPASAEIMRKWVSEGRVSSDSLVWREGWADWKSAVSQFPQLGGEAGGVPAITPPQPTAMSAPTVASPGMGGAAAATRAYPRRRNNNSLALVLVIVLTLAALGLLGIFFAVVTAWS